MDPHLKIIDQVLTKSQFSHNTLRLRIISLFIQFQVELQDLINFPQAQAMLKLKTSQILQKMKQVRLFSNNFWIQQS